MDDNKIGKTLDRYTILEKTGEGGMSYVYKAFDTKLECDVAVKVIRTERLTIELMDRTVQRFKREAKALAQLTHPNIVKVIDFGDHEGQPYLVMEYLPGGTVKQKYQGAIPWQEATALLLPVARALDYAHRQGIVHRDIKPSNILITDSGEPMLSDFGIAKIFDADNTAELTGSSTGIGTPDYMAPEQATSKNIDHRADIYALGIVLYELITGRKPFHADTPLGVLFKHASEPLPLPTKYIPDLPEGVERVLLIALAKSPEDRFPDMGGFVHALEDLTEGRTTELPAKKAVKSQRTAPGKPVKKPRSDRTVNWRPAPKPLVWIPVGIAALIVLVFVLVKFIPLDIFGPTSTGTNEPLVVAGILSDVGTPTPEIPIGYARLAFLAGDATLEIPGGGREAILSGADVPSGAGTYIETGNGVAVLILPDGSTILLDGDTRLELTQVADPRQGSLDTLLKLYFGQVLSFASIDVGETFKIEAESGAWAGVTGSVMGVIYDPEESQLLAVDCLEGHCVHSGVNDGDELELIGGKSSYLTGEGSPEENCQSAGEVWQDLYALASSGTGLPALPAISASLVPCTTSTPAATVVVTTPTQAPTYTPTPIPVCYSLTTSAVNGSIGVSPNANCAGNKYRQGTIVTLTASAAQNFYFVNWSGDASGSSNPLTLTITGNRSIGAEFGQTLPNYSLSTSINPPAGGTVGVSPSGSSFQSGTTVSVSASPATGYVFANWSGSISTSANPASVTMDGDKSITANFAACFSISTAVIGPGSVIVSPSPNCSGGKYIPGTSVSLTAVPSNSVFSNWTGSVSSVSNPVVLTMDGNKSVTANFTPCYSLSTSVVGSGSIGVLPSPNCGSNYVSGTSVTPTANPATNYVFTGWSGACTGTGTCSINMNANKSVTATFTYSPGFTLTTGVSPAGGGVISPTSQTYTNGTVVNVTQNPNSGYYFTGWSGACSGTGSCSVTMDSNKSVTANYGTCATLSTNVNPAGYGSVSVLTPSNCLGGGYVPGTPVSIQAVPASGYWFTNWSIGASGNTNPTSVTVSSNITVRANFVSCYTLSTGVNGSGSIGLSPSPSCGGSDYQDGSYVTVTQTPGSGYVFTGWSGDCSGTGSCQVLMNQARTVVANYAQCYSLTIEIRLAGYGSVNNYTPPNCGSSYLPGTSITLEAFPAAGKYFGSWSGDIPSQTTNPVTFTINGNLTVRASFFDL